MSTEQPTFKQCVRLIDICAQEVDAYAEMQGSNPALKKRLQHIANVIADKSAQLKLDKQWSDYHRQHKTAPRGTALVS